MYGKIANHTRWDKLMEQLLLYLSDLTLAKPQTPIGCLSLAIILDGAHPTYALHWGRSFQEPLISRPDRLSFSWRPEDFAPGQRNVAAPHSPCPAASPSEDLRGLYS